MRLPSIYSHSLPLLIALASACSPAQTELEPLGASETLSRTEDGVQVTVQETTWPGFDSIRAEVTPLRVVIRNESTEPVALRYEDFSVVSLDGERYRALPLWAIHDATIRPVPVSPRFGFAGFRVSPAYAPYYPQMDVTSVASTSPAYARSHYDYWARVDLPTQTMRERALPEGVIGEGGHVDGYLYFEHVPDDAEIHVLQADVPSDGSIRIPLSVDGH